MLSERLAQALIKSGDNAFKEWLEGSGELRAAVSESGSTAVATTEDDADDDARFDSALGVVVRHVRFVVRAEGAAIALAGPEGVVCRASCGYAPETGVRLDPNSGVCGQCYSKGENVVWSASESAATPRLSSIIAVPIRAEGSTRGLIAAFSTAQNQFHGEQFPQLTRIADALAEQFVSPPMEAAPTVEEPAKAEVPSEAEQPAAATQAESQSENPQPAESAAPADEFAPDLAKAVRPLRKHPVPKRINNLVYFWAMVVILILIACFGLVAAGGGGQWLQRLLHDLIK